MPKNKSLNKFDAFVQQMGPSLYRALQRYGVQNREAAFANMMRQLALESNYGTSDQAINNNNFGGVGFNPKTNSYYSYKDIDAFTDAYVKLMNSRYRKALDVYDPREYTKIVHGLGYFGYPNDPKKDAEALLEYQNNMATMRSLNTALANHVRSNPDIYPREGFVNGISKSIYRPEQDKIIVPFWAPTQNMEPQEEQKVELAPPTMIQRPQEEPETVQAPTIVDKLKEAQQIFDMFGLNNSKKKSSLPELIPDLDEYMKQEQENYFRDIMGIGDVYDNLYAYNSRQPKPLGYFKCGKLPKHGDGIIGSIGNWIQDKTNQVQEGIRNHLYNSVTPIGYDVLSAAKEVLQGHRENNYLAENPFREALFAKYMRQPTFNFQGGSGNTSDWLVESPYLPSLGTVAGGKAYRLNPELVQKYSGKWKLNYLDNDQVKRYFQERAKQGKNNILIDDGSSDLGTYTMGSGRDKNGYFISVYDHWGLQPGEGKDANALLQKASGALGIKDDAMQPVINTDPFTYYDRRYLTEDEWKALGGYANGKLPMFANGGIHINPANRGKFNATKKRTGKTTEELTHSKNPLTRKRAIFALNSRKWKH